MSKINVLPKFVQNVISSGQVIDRPASVVKELVENSIDAGATKITIYVKESGLNSIAVVDNGHGIDHDDVRNAFKSFSTSKISTVDDLTEIKTMGFRGEALAAIAAISNVNIWTKTATCDLGTMATFSFGKEEKFEYCASGEQGTRIEVTDLYGNVPNKKRFLKRPSVELSEITNIITRLILSNPYVTFKYVIDNNEVLSTMGRGLDEAVFVLYGRNCMENCFRVENEFNDVSVVGLVGGSAYVKPNSTYQTVIVNGRYVKDDTVSIAVKNAFDCVTTTLTLSPLKNAQLLNTIGEQLCNNNSLTWIFSDFKKQGGVLRSVELSKQHQLYRQNYCGCEFSKRQSEQAQND